MTALRWATPLLVGALASNAAVAAAQEPAPAPTPAPAPAATTEPAPADPAPAPADPAPPATPAPTPPPIQGDVAGSVVYVTTVTTTTTILTAPITVIAAPVTTTINTTNSTSNSTSGDAPGDAAPSRDAAPAPTRLVMNLTGCGRGARGSRAAVRPRARRAHVRLAGNATLVVRVNGKRVTALRIPSSTRHARVALRLRLAPSGMLTIRRPSGRVLAVQGCTPSRGSRPPRHAALRRRADAKDSPPGR